MNEKIFVTGRLFAAAAAAALLALPAARAQEAPAPSSPAPAAAAAQPVTLAYKFKTGQVQRFKTTVKSDLVMEPEGGGGGLGTFPIEISGVTGHSEKIAGTRQGTATIAVTTENVTITSGAMGMKTVIRIQNGKVTATSNGQPIQMTGNPTLQNLASRKPVMIRREPNGAVSFVEASAAAGANALLGGSMFGALVQFPPGPVAVGESWETSQKVPNQLPGGLGGGEMAPDVDVKFRHTLRGIETKNGKKFALIDTIGNAATASGNGSGPVRGFQQDITGTTRFDLDRGAVVSAQYTTTMDMKMAIPQLGGPAPGGGQAPTGMRMSGTVEVTIAETAAAKATPAAARAKRAPKKPARKK